MAKETSYVILLDQDIQLRVRFVRERHQVTNFVVQLECQINNHWYPVVRYDTAHNFTHCDILRPDGSQEKRPIPVEDYNDGLTYAQKDIMTNFRRYCMRFQEWLNG